MDFKFSWLSKCRLLLFFSFSSSLFAIFVGRVTSVKWMARTVCRKTTCLGGLHSSILQLAKGRQLIIRKGWSSLFSAILMGAIMKSLFLHSRCYYNAGKARKAPVSFLYFPLGSAATSLPSRCLIHLSVVAALKAIPPRDATGLKYSWKKQRKQYV